MITLFAELSPPVDFRAFSLRRKKMKTKKLVLGFCVLAAVTGSAPQVFGKKPVSLKGLLIAAIPDGRIRSTYEAAYDAVVLQLKERIEDFVKIGNDEVRLVSEVFLKQRRLHHLCRAHTPRRESGCCWYQESY
jgi:hypothetical protein